MMWKLVEDMDEDSLKKLLGELPAWIKFDDFERARFVNQALVGMWGFLDMAICNAIKHHVEPAIQDNLPFAISGFTFEKLSFGDSPFQIRGIKHASLYSGPGEPMALAVEVEASWVTQPDIVAKLMPSKRLKLSHVDIRPSMYVKVDHLVVEGRLRLIFPLQLSLPIFNGISISFLTTPKIDMSLKMLRDVDIMSMPALQEWATGLIAEHVNRAMTFPSTIDISFIGDQVKEFARENNWPTGIATLELKTVHMPLWQTQACMPSVVLKPATWVDLSLVCDVHAMTYPLVMDPQRPHTMEVWQASLPVFDPGQTLQVFIVENFGGNRGYPVSSAPIPLAPLFSGANVRNNVRTRGDTTARTRRTHAGSSHLPPSTLGLEQALGSAISGPVPGNVSRVPVNHHGFHRAKSDSELRQTAGLGSDSSSDSDDAKPVLVPTDLEDLLHQSMPKTPPAQRNSFAEGEQRNTAYRANQGPHPKGRPSSLRVTAQSSAQSPLQSPARTSAGHQDAAGGAVSTSSAADTREGASEGGEQGGRRSPMRVGPWKGLAALFRRRTAPAQSATTAAGTSEPSPLSTQTSLPASAQGGPATVAMAWAGTSGAAAPPEPTSPARGAPADLHAQPQQDVSPARNAAVEPRGRRNKRGGATEGNTRQQRIKIKTGAAETGDASTQPSLCSTPPSPFGDIPNDAFGSASSTEDYVNPENSEGLARCTGCNAVLRPGEGVPDMHAQAQQNLLVASMPSREGSGVVAQRGGFSSGASESPSFREWTGSGRIAPMQCGDCARRNAAWNHRGSALAVDEDERWGPWSSPNHTAFTTKVKTSARNSIHASPSAATAAAAAASITIPPGAGGPSTTGVHVTSPSPSCTHAAHASTSHAHSEPRVVPRSGGAAAATAAAGNSYSHSHSHPSHYTHSHNTSPPFVSAAESVASSQGGHGPGQPGLPTAAVARSPTTVQPITLANTTDLDWEDLWGGPRSAWDVSSLRRGLMTPLPPTSPPTLPSSSSLASHLSTKPSQDGLSDMIGGAASLDTEPSQAEANSNSSRNASAPGIVAAGVLGGRFPTARESVSAGPPLVARSRDPHVKCEVPMWLPDCKGTTAAMGPGGAYILMRPLKQRTWYKHWDVRWQTDILQLLPRSTVLEMKRCAAAILVREAESAFSGPHPLIRSYNQHASLEGHTREGKRWSHGAARGALRKRPPQNAPSMLAGAMHAVMMSVVSVAAAPMVALSGGPRRNIGMSHLPADIESDSPVYSAPSTQPESALKPQDVQLEANAGAGAVQFRGFAGALKAHLQWLPLQWTYIAKGEKPPPVARSERYGAWHTAGVLMVRLMCTTVYGTKMQRPQVMLQLDHVEPGRQELRRTGVRERWAKQRTSLHHGTVHWELKFSFCVEVEDAPDAAAGGRGGAGGSAAVAAAARQRAGRCLQVDVMEVEASWGDRMRAYWSPDADSVNIPEDEDGQSHDESATECLGSALVPLAKLVKTPNKPCQAVWQLQKTSYDGPATVQNVGSVTLETSWLPACTASMHG